MPVLSRPWPHRSAVLLAALLAGAPAAAGQNGIAVVIDEAQLVRIDAPAAEVIIGNPSIADVAVQSGRLLVLTGKSFGATNLIVLDPTGREIVNTKITVGPDSAQTVALTKGTASYSHVCAPRCRPILNPGDEPAYADALVKQTRDKLGVAQSVLDESSAVGQ